MNSQFIGPSYNLKNKRASVQRTVNLIPVPLEPGNERSAWVMKDVFGLTKFDLDEIDIDFRITEDGTNRCTEDNSQRVIE